MLPRSTNILPFTRKVPALWRFWYIARSSAVDPASSPSLKVIGQTGRIHQPTSRQRVDMHAVPLFCFPSCLGTEFTLVLLRASSTSVFATLTFTRATGRRAALPTLRQGCRHVYVLRLMDLNRRMGTWDFDAQSLIISPAPSITADSGIKGATSRCGASKRPINRWVDLSTQNARAGRPLMTFSCRAT
jgi:hypothetical protein